MALKKINLTKGGARNLTEIIKKNYDAYIAQGDLSGESMPTGLSELATFKSQKFTPMGATGEKGMKISSEPITDKIDYETIETGETVSVEITLKQITQELFNNWKVNIKNIPVTLLLIPKEAAPSLILTIQDIILTKAPSFGAGESFALVAKATREADDWTDVVTIHTIDDGVAPAWADTYPKLGTPTASGAALLVETSKDATVYFVVLDDGDAAPSAAQVVAGQDAASAALSSSKRGVLPVIKDTEASITLDGLDASTSYDIYVVAKDGAGVLTDPVKKDLTTAAS